MQGSGGHHLDGLVSRRGLLLGGLISAAGALAAAPGGSEATSGSPMAGSATGRPLASVPLAPAAARARAGPPPASPTTSPSVADRRASVPPDPEEVKANELGLVPVMMYHRIQPKITGEYDMTPADFRAQLQTLFAMRMRPVRTIDLVRGHFPIEAGYTPVVLTFDDGYPNQFTVDDAGHVDPHCGIGILIDVCRQFPDCTTAGSLNINRNPFGISPHRRTLSHQGSWHGETYRNEGVLTVGRIRPPLPSPGRSTRCSSRGSAEAPGTTGGTPSPRRTGSVSCGRTATSCTSSRETPVASPSPRPPRGPGRPPTGTGS
jgi:hypothetical protein